jgi:hypothetical protein
MSCESHGCSFGGNKKGEKETLIKGRSLFGIVDGMNGGAGD